MCFFSYFIYEYLPYQVQPHFLQHLLVVSKLVALVIKITYHHRHHHNHTNEFVLGYMLEYHQNSCV